MTVLNFRRDLGGGDFERVPPERVNAIDNLGKVLLIVQICQLEYESLYSMTSVRYHDIKEELPTSGRPTCLTKLKNTFMLSE